jgi:hypothetical protein
MQRKEARLTSHFADAGAGDQFSKWIKVAALEKQPTWFPDTFFTYNLAQLEVYAKEIEIDWSKLSTLPKKI